MIPPLFISLLFLLVVCVLSLLLFFFVLVLFFLCWILICNPCFPMARAVPGPHLFATVYQIVLGNKVVEPEIRFQVFALTMHREM